MLTQLRVKVSRGQLIDSLRSDRCPACGGTKKPGQTFCRADYRRLTAAEKHRLHDPVGNGYEEAVAAALVRQGVSSWISDDGEERELY